MFAAKNPQQENPVATLVKNFIGKLRQSPEVYPIKYYKKGKPHNKRWQPQVK
jgi:hypothetical protein